MVDTLEEKDATISSNNRTIELLEEQLYFARELVQQVDNFVESNLTKAKQKMYYSFRDESCFDV